MKIIISTGGTGGHVFAAYEFAKEMSFRKHQIVIVADKRLKLYNLKGYENFTIEYIPISSPNKGLIKFLYTLTVSYFKSMKIIRRFKPNVVIGFGAYPSLPVLLSASSLLITTIVHEANSVLGRVNSLFAPISKYLAISMPTEINKKIVPLVKNKVLLTGMPVREGKQPKFSNNYNFTDSINILIMSGSECSELIDKTVSSAICVLKIPLKLNIVQQCKVSNIKDIRDLYNNQKHISAELDTFFFDIENKILSSHLIICRAGAGTLNQICMMGKPAIYIPYRGSKDNHQVKNAQQLVEAKAGVMIEEENLSVDNIVNEIHKLTKNQKLLQEMGINARNFYTPNGKVKLAKIVETINIK